ncbi:glucosamine--fructose-6-phosphate aminotransferase domain protein, partial [Vibrio parahaemolyticus V-223/04]
KVT